MRKLFGTSILSLSMMLCVGSLPLESHAAGRFEPGFVNVEGGQSYKSMEGTMHNRYSRTVTPYQTALGAYYQPGYVLFWAMDSEGDYFSCAVRDTNRLYDDAVKIVGSMTNGTRLSAAKASGSDDCTGVQVEVNSYYMQ